MHKRKWINLKKICFLIEFEIKLLFFLQLSIEFSLFLYPEKEHFQFIFSDLYIKNLHENPLRSCGWSYKIANEINLISVISEGFSDFPVILKWIAQLRHKSVLAFSEAEGKTDSFKRIINYEKQDPKSLVINKS